MSDFADWTPVVIKGSSKKVTGASSKQVVKLSGEAMHLRKIASEETPKLKVLESASRQEIIMKRVGNKWDQSDLNRHCAFPPNTIRDIEAGRYTPSIGQLQTLNRVLKCGLKFV
jgi:ribosome-binding protein aMBF1 (putative translation factor)